MNKNIEITLYAFLESKARALRSQGFYASETGGVTTFASPDVRGALLACEEAMGVINTASIDTLDAFKRAADGSHTDYQEVTSPAFRQVFQEALQERDRLQGLPSEALAVEAAKARVQLDRKHTDPSDEERSLNQRLMQLQATMRDPAQPQEQREAARVELRRLLEQE